MKTDEIQRALGEVIRGIEVINTHDHHGYDQWHSGLSLTRVLRSSSAPWSCEDPRTMYQERGAFLRRVRQNSQYFWLSRALQELYDHSTEVTAENWDKLSGQIRRAHEDRGWHLRLLTEQSRHQASILDSFKEPGSDQGHPDLFKPAYRVDMFLISCHEELADHDGNNALVEYDEHPGTFDGYLDLVRECVVRARERGCVALKVACAYDRPLRFDGPRKSDAARVYGRHPSELEEGDLAIFGNFVLHHVLKLADELDFPVQVHLGVVSLENANPLEFAAVLARYPGVRFDLFHGGYPWTEVVSALAHQYRNAWLNLCWLPMISTTHAEAVLNEWIDVAGSCERIVWGADAMTGEETYGALLAMEHVLRHALAERIRLGLTDLAGACDLSRKILHDNAKKLYEL